MRFLQYIHRNELLTHSPEPSYLQFLRSNMEVKVFNRAGRELAVLTVGEEASVFALKREFYRKCEV